MGAGDNIGTVVDERGTALEAFFWGGVFLFTLLLFVWEFGLGVIETGEAGLLPIAIISDFAKTMWLSGLIGGGGVVLLIVLAVFRFSSGVREYAAPLVPGQGNLKFAIFVLAVTAIVTTTVFTGASTLAQTDEAGPVEAAQSHGIDKELEMSVLAGQWFWRFNVKGVPFTQAERVVLPAQTIIQFQTTSADVIHSFSIKHLGITKDAIPGQMNQAWFYVGEVDGETELTFSGENGTTHTVSADTYQVRCAELCGKGHSKMLGTIYIVSQEDYETWVHAQGGEAAYSEPDNGIEMNVTTTGGGHGDEGGQNGGGHDDGGDH